MILNKQAILIENGRIIDPLTGLDDTGDLFIKDGKIAWLSKPEMTPVKVDHQVINATGLIVCPGFIDMHCHLRQPGYEQKETIATGTRAAARGGFTTVCAMPNTDPPADTPDSIRYVLNTASREGMIRVLPIACITRRRQGKELVDMTALAAAGAAAFSDDGSPVLNDNVMTIALQNSRIVCLPVIDHCENTGLSNGWDMNNGDTAHLLGLRGMPDSAEEQMIERDIRINRDIGGMLHIAHVSTAASVSLIRKAKKEGAKITAEATPHHLTLDDTIVKSSGNNAKVNPPLRSQKDIEALIDGLLDDTIDMIATDHAPHTTAEKNGVFSGAAFGISSLETAFGSLMGLVHHNKIPLKTIIAKLTAAPVKLFGGRYGITGSLRTGTTADITLFDPDFDWVVDPDKFASKGKNTPLSGTILRGKVIWTIYGGSVVYRDDEAITEMKGHYE